MVSGTQVVQDESITLNGNLTVQSGGNLTLRDVSLAMNVQSDGQYGILVQPGGSIYIYNSRITASDQTHKFSLVAQGSNFVMRDTTVEDVGWCQWPGYLLCIFDNSTRSHAAVFVESNGADIENDTISRGAIGLILTGEGDTVSMNVVEQNNFSALAMIGVSAAEVTNNSFYQDPSNFRNAIVALDHVQNSTLSHNKIEETDMQGWYTPNPAAHPMDGIEEFLGSYGDLIAHNTIAVSKVGIGWMDSDVRISDNHIVCGEVFVWFGGVNNEVIGNTMVGVLGQYQGGIGLGGRNSVVANNSLFDVTQGISLDHTDNASVIDNTVTSQCLAKALTDCTNSIDSHSLELFHSSNNTFLGNTINRFGYGLLLSGGSNGNVFEDNSFNASHSVTIIDSDSNLLYGNNFYDLSGSSGGPYDSGNNSWYSGHDGNYWSYFGCGQVGGGSANCGEYNRTSVPPEGDEKFTLSGPVSLESHPIVMPKPLPFPASSHTPISNQGSTVISDLTETISSGCIPGNVTIVNSTLTLGTNGSVAIAGCGQSGPTIIENSRLLDGGFGFAINANPSYPLIIANSTIDGAGLQDVDASNIVLENSTITNSQGDLGITVQSAETVTIVNCTFSDEYEAINPAGASKGIVIDGNSIRDSLLNAININGVGATNIVIANNTITGSWGDGITAGSDPVPIVVEGNAVSGVKGTAINVGGNGGLVKGNTVLDSGTGIAVSGSGDTIYHNNMIGCAESAGSSSNNAWSYDGEGNYWSDYHGSIPTLSGIGDTPYVYGNIVDNYPFMRPNGWLTKFYLTIDSDLPASTPFTINESSFRLGNDGTATLRLGYVASYVISLPQSVSLSNGSRLVFDRWGDGLTSPTRTLALSSNSTLSAIYELANVVTTTTMSTTATTSAATTTSATTSATATSTSNSSTTSAAGTANYALYAVVGAVAVVIIALASIFALRKRR